MCGRILSAVGSVQAGAPPSTPRTVARRLRPMALLLAALALGAPTTGVLQVGDQAPDFSAKTHTGAHVTLKDFAGKKLIIWFYPRAGTGG